MRAGALVPLLVFLAPAGAAAAPAPSAPNTPAASVPTTPSAPVTPITPDPARAGQSVKIICVGGVPPVPVDIGPDGKAIGDPCPGSSPIYLTVSGGASSSSLFSTSSLSSTSSSASLSASSSASLSASPSASPSASSSASPSASLSASQPTLVSSTSGGLAQSSSATSVVPSASSQSTGGGIVAPSSSSQSTAAASSVVVPSAPSQSTPGSASTAHSESTPPASVVVETSVSFESPPTVSSESTPFAGAFDPFSAAQSLPADAEITPAGAFGENASATAPPRTEATLSAAPASPSNARGHTPWRHGGSHWRPGHKGHSWSPGVDVNDVQEADSLATTDDSQAENVSTQAVGSHKGGGVAGQTSQGQTDQAAEIGATASTTARPEAAKESGKKKCDGSRTHDA